MDLADGIADSVAYLESDAARQSLALDPYWPKWHSPWWHMLLLHELGETRRIPASIAAALAAGLDRLLHFLPITPEESAGVDMQRDLACHCALGTMIPVLADCGIDVERALPWVKPWFVRYQMADGGLTCDETAYLVTGECPSSMVGTVAPLEAMLRLGAVTDAERAFVARAGEFLIGRALVRGSATAHNAAERDSALAWPALAFPRFYFYDWLRGLAALVRWAEATGRPLPEDVVAPVEEALDARWPDGVVRVERQSYAGRMTIVPPAAARVPATTFPLLDAVSVVGAPSEALTRQWAAVRAGLKRMRTVTPVG